MNLQGKLHYLYWDLLRYGYRKWSWDRAAKHSEIDGVALMFHNVTNEWVDADESCKCTVAQFINALLQNKAEGRCFVSVEEMLSFIKSKSSEKFVVVTFDDVPDNFYSNAYPFLKRENIPFILFITTSFVGRPGFLSKEQLLELDKDNLCTIGAHTLTHPMLRKATKMKEELTESKRQLEELLGHSVDYMAYPYGRQSSVSRKVMRTAKDAGYKCAFGTIQSPITDMSSKNLFYLPRIVRK